MKRRDCQVIDSIQL